MPPVLVTCFPWSFTGTVHVIGNLIVLLFIVSNVRNSVGNNANVFESFFRNNTSPLMHQRYQDDEVLVDNSSELEIIPSPPTLDPVQ